MMDEVKLLEIRVKLVALMERIKAKGGDAHQDEQQTLIEANLAIRHLEKENKRLFSAYTKRQRKWAELSIENSQLKKQIKALADNVQL